MPSYLRELSRSVCWNCDQDADDTVGITLRTPTGAGATFALCGACDDAISSALAEVAGQAGIAIECCGTVRRSAR